MEEVKEMTYGEKGVIRKTGILSINIGGRRVEMSGDPSLMGQVYAEV